MKSQNGIVDIMRMEYGDEFKEVKEEELEKRELNCIQKWLESRGFKVVEK